MTKITIDLTAPEVEALVAMALPITAGIGAGQITTPTHEHRALSKLALAICDARKESNAPASP